MAFSRAAKTAVLEGHAAQVGAERLHCGIGKAIHVARSRGHQDALGAVRVDGFFHLSGDFVKCFVPADCLEFAFASLADALKRSTNSVFGVDPLDAGKTACAAFAFMGIVRFDTDNLAVLDVRLEIAVQALHRAGCVECFQGRFVLPDQRSACRLHGGNAASARREEIAAGNCHCCFVCHRKFLLSRRRQPLRLLY